MPQFYCNRCTRPLTVTSVPQSATLNGSRGSPGTAVKAFVTTCRHMFCQNCIEKCKGACMRCNKPCRATKIDERVPVQLRSCFEPIPQQIEQFQRQMDTVRSIQLDQNHHRQQQLLQTSHRYNEAYAREKANKKEATQRFEEAKALNRKLKLYVQMVQQQRSHTVTAGANEANPSADIHRNEQVPNERFRSNGLENQHHGRHQNEPSAPLHRRNDGNMMTGRSKHPNAPRKYL